MLIVHLISSTPSVACLCSRLYIYIFLGSYRERHPGSVGHVTALSMHTVTLHHTVEHFLRIKSALKQSLTNEKSDVKDLMTRTQNCYFLENSASSVVTSCCIRGG